MSYYKENQKIIEHNERVLKDINNFAEYINGDLALKYSIEECQLLQPLVMLLCRYIMYSGLYEDVVFHLETASDIREVVKNARAYFIETSFFLLHSEEPISRRMEEDLINFVFFSIESAGLEHVEKRQPTFVEFLKAEGYEYAELDDSTFKLMSASYLLKYVYKESDDEELFPATVPPDFQSFEEYNAGKQKQAESEEIKEEPKEEPKVSDDVWFPTTVPPCFKSFEEYTADKHKQFEQAYESHQITQQIIKEIEVGIDTCDTLNDV